MRSNTGSPPPPESEGSVRIRQYDPEERADVLDLDEAVWDRTMSEEWFAWKYERNPYVSEPPVFIARADGRVVGARPFMAFRLRIGDALVVAFQPTDTMVHPDYRGRGIFTRMTRQAIDYYADREPELCFNFPNQMAWPGYRKLGWRPVGERTTYYRVQNPTALSATKLDGRAGRLVGDVATSAVRALQSLWARAGPSPNGFAVERQRGVPAEELAALYRRAVPEAIHAHRDEAFYRWRFASPAWTRHTYVARRGGTPVAGVIARSRTTADGVTVTQLADVVPLVGDDEWTAAVAGLLERVVADHADADILAAHESPVPGELLGAFGFLPDRYPPLSWVASHRCTFAVRPLGDLDGDAGGAGNSEDAGNPEDAWEANGYRLTDDSNWLLSFGERDTA